MIICRRNSERRRAILISVKQVSKRFRLNGRPISVLEDISLTLGRNESAALLGPSGCGKSTLLSLIAGFFPPDRGEIAVSGRVSITGQQDLLLPHRSLLDNVCLPAEVRGRAGLPAARERAQSLLPRFGLAGFGNSYPAQLSGGMRQRASLLRTVMDGGDFWLLDEPFARLDALTKEELQEWLFGLARDYCPGLLLVTHDIEEALRLCDKIYLLTPRPGKIFAEIAVEKNRLTRQKQQIRSLLAHADGERA